MSQNACVLVSGGVESAVLLHEARRRHSRATPLYVKCGLRWEEAELFWLRRLLKHRSFSGVNPLQILAIPMRAIYGRHWSVTGDGVPGASSKDAAVYLPGRNIIFLSQAAVYAAIHRISVIEIGVLAGNPFPDSSLQFFNQMATSLSQGLGSRFQIRAPFRKSNKKNILQKGINYQLPLELTFSCINPKKRIHCGVCNKCAERQKAFVKAGIHDRTKYFHWINVIPASS